MNSIANYHTHTVLCGHARGKPVDYVEQAKKEGCLALGFSDHCPFPENFPDPWENTRMDLSQVDEYLQDIEDAKKIAPFPIHFGFECEWDSAYKNWYKDELIGHFGAEYLILGQHWIIKNGSHLGTQEILNDAELNQYADLLIDGMKTGIFKILAHPDLFMGSCREWTENAKAVSRAIIDAAIDLDMPIEVNGYGLAKPTMETNRGIRQRYPYAEFWEMAAQTKVKIVCNSDAHFPKDVIYNAWRARDFAARFGIKPWDLEIV